MDNINIQGGPIKVQKYVTTKQKTFNGRDYLNFDNIGNCVHVHLF